MALTKYDTNFIVKDLKNIIKRQSLLRGQVEKKIKIEKNVVLKLVFPFGKRVYLFRADLISSRKGELWLWQQSDLY